MGVLQKQLVWLVTGTSSGFGHELALAALSKGEKVIATARSRSLDKLGVLREKGAAIAELDVGWPFEKLKEAALQIEEIYGRVDVLFNNAGFSYVMALEESTAEETQEIFNVNVFGGLNLARALLPGMRARKEGAILWNGSLHGWKASVDLGLYTATKFCLRGLSQSLHEEIAPLGLRSIIVEPGYHRTSIIENINTYESRIADYDPITRGFYKQLKDYSGKQLGDTKRAVEIILDMVRGEGVAEGKAVPATFALGSDCYKGIEDTCNAALREIHEWKDVICSTDIVT